MRCANAILKLSLIGMSVCTAGAVEVTVSPGQSLQAAMAKVRKDGGMVTLEKGIHKVDRSVMFSSNVTVQGDPSAKPDEVKIVASDPGMRTAIFTNDHAISNVVIRNLMICGNLKPEEKRYPPETHKNPVAHMRKGHLGILFTAGGESYDSAENRKITIENVEVTNCSMGIHLKGSRDVTLSRLKIHDNGMVERYFHNIYLRRVFKVSINDSAFYNSPTGCGINISQSCDVRVVRCSAKGNFWRGIRIYGEHSWIVRSIYVAGNRCLNNGDAGLMLFNIDGGTVLRNTARQNKGGNLKSGGLKKVKFSDNEF